MSSEIEEILDEVAQRFNRFKSFQVVSDYPYDHHFVTNPFNPNTLDLQCLLQWGSKKPKRGEQEIHLRKRIQQEWEILEANLPNSVYVRTYESRIDLMRAVVIPLEYSPYSYGLFFFDIFFPLGYPAKPPQLFHHPNRALNFSEDNCSALYNAVRSTWDPKTSNVYRMLGFIQGSVLMNSKFYSKDVGKDLLLSYKAMLSFLTHPPSGFRDFVRGNFRKYSHEILLKFKGKGSSDSKSEIARMFKELYHAFEWNGSYCKHLRGVLHM